MKTHYRYPATMSVYATIRNLHDDRARWKRKNRIARLKAKIARLTSENKWLSEERLKYINFYYNALSDLVKTSEMLAMKKPSRRSAEHRKETQQ